jgi:hypothetical protein
VDKSYLSLRFVGPIFVGSRILGGIERLLEAA